MTRKPSTHPDTSFRQIARPLHVVDPATKTAYVLVRADVYEQLLAGTEVFDPRNTYPFIEDVMREDDARDPMLAGYQKITSKKRAS